MDGNRSLILPEILARADLIETEVEIARAILLGWLDDHDPSDHEIRQLGSILSRHAELTAVVLDVPEKRGAQFEKAKLELLAEHGNKLE
jgi:hypothetical protein